MKSKQLQAIIESILYTSNMQKTPQASRIFLPSDFQRTTKFTTSDSFDFSVTSEQLDVLLTPKCYPSFAPLTDRQLPFNQFNSIKNNRSRLIDWYLQVCNAYNLGWECFWMIIQLLDSLIAEFNYVSLNNIHLVGIVCCFIIAKFLGKSLSLYHVVVGLSQGKFSASNVIMQEQQILMLIFMRSNFQRNNFYSYLMDNYWNLPLDVLAQVMKMITLAMMRPDIAFKSLPVRTYRELVDFLLIQISCTRRVPILQEIYHLMIGKYGSSNIGLGDTITFV